MPPTFILDTNPYATGGTYAVHIPFPASIQHATFAIRFIGRNETQASLLPVVGSVRTSYRQIAEASEVLRVQG